MHIAFAINLVSVVIICRNAANSIELAIQSAMQVSDDVIIIDTGSTDATIRHIKKFKVRLYEKQWQGYGATKNLGNDLAHHPWILSMDADEELDEELIEAIKKADLSDPNTVFSMQRLTYLGEKAIYFGEWGRSYITRLFNRNNAQWDDSEVHEALVFKQKPQIQRLSGTLHHYTSPGIELFRQKLGHYANLMADKYFARGKQVNDAKLILSPAMHFAKNYFLKAGFLDGKEGWQIAKANAWYTFEKYRQLHYRYKKHKNSTKRND